MVQLNSQIPLDRFSSVFSFKTRRLASPENQGAPRLVCTDTTDESAAEYAHYYVCSELPTVGVHPDTCPSTEPIHVPRVRIQSVDFPWVHSPIDQRLLALETSCGLRYSHDPLYHSTVLSALSMAFRKQVTHMATPKPTRIRSVRSSQLSTLIGIPQT